MNKIKHYSVPEINCFLKLVKDTHALKVVGNVFQICGAKKPKAHLPYFVLAFGFTSTALSDDDRKALGGT